MYPSITRQVHGLILLDIARIGLLVLAKLQPLEVLCCERQKQRQGRQETPQEERETEDHRPDS